MAAIVPYLEREVGDVELEDVESAPLGGLGAAVATSTTTAQKLLEQSHAGLVRFNWNRQLIEQHLRDAQYWLEEEKGETVIRISPALPRDLRPWKLMSPSAKPDRFRLFGDDNAKMGCLTWDLPAGPPAVGGTCPAAAAGQTVLPPESRTGQLTKDRQRLRVLPPGADTEVEFDESRAICGFCYAGEGNYDYTEIQAAAICRYWWTKELIETDAGMAEWVEVMAHAITRKTTPIAVDKYSDVKIRPVRVHSAGDFFSPRYAEAWMHLANRVYTIDPAYRFWCPTRTWASPGFSAKWPKILELLEHENLVVRPSAYHVGDNAPDALASGQARGTTSLAQPGGTFAATFPDAVWRGENDARRDHDCPVYALGPGEHSCAVARCRVCWTRPDLRVNYTLH